MRTYVRTYSKYIGIRMTESDSQKLTALSEAAQQTESQTLRELVRQAQATDPNTEDSPQERPGKADHAH